MDVGFKSCKKHPGHSGFLPVDNLTKDHLPASLQTTECLESIHSIAERTVRVIAHDTSVSRPERFPDSNSPYPYFNLGQLSRKFVRYGTGYLEDNIVTTVEKKKCPCSECLNSGNPATQFWKFVVSTATHLIFDDSEAKSAVFELFYDSHKKEDVKHLYGTTLCEEKSKSERIYTDRCRVVCITHDQGLSYELIQMIKKPIDIAMGSQVIIASHPHGGSKHISVGDFLGIGFKVLKIGENNVRFPPGREETMKKLKRALHHPSKTPQKDDTEMATNLEPESFICGASVSILHFSSVRLDSETKWYQFPEGTKFVTHDGNIVEVPEGLQVDADNLYCYITYNTPTCPGSTGAGVFYNGERFTHVGCFTSPHQGQFVNRSGFIKVMDCALIGKDDDTISVGGSSVGDEGFCDYIADVEDAVEDCPSEVVSLSGVETASKSKRVKPLDMLNETVVNFLQKIEKSYADVASHEDEYYHIENFIEDESAMFPEQYTFGSRSELERVLNKLVFNKEFSAHIASVIPEEILLSQEASYWAVRFLEDCQPSDQEGPYLYNPALRDSWFNEEIDLPAECSGGAGKGDMGRKKIKIFNRLDKDVDETAIQTCSKSSYHYHGTSFGNARNILQLGIDLNVGKLKKDYSHGHGFYVSKDFLEARDWARRFHLYPVVLVFKTPNDFFSDKTIHIHLRATDTITVAILKYFRSGRTKEREAVGRVKNPSLDECHSISGPILKDLTGFNKGNTLILKSHQTCICKQNCANAFYRYIDCIIFNP